MIGWYLITDYLNLKSRSIQHDKENISPKQEQQNCSSSSTKPLSKPNPLATKPNPLATKPNPPATKPNPPTALKERRQALRTEREAARRHRTARKFQKKVPTIFDLSGLKLTGFYYSFTQVTTFKSSKINH